MQRFVVEQESKILSNVLNKCKQKLALLKMYQEGTCLQRKLVFIWFEERLYFVF